MDITITPKAQSFKGQVIVLGKISSNQNYLFNLHKAKLVQMIKDKPYDLFVKQSKSGKTITLSTERNAKSGFFVRKNKQNFEECADLAIKDKDNRLAIKRQENESEEKKQAEILYLYHQLKFEHNLFFWF